MRGLILLGWLLFFGFLLWPLLRLMIRQRLAGSAGGRARPRALHDELVKDPVCQTYVVRSRAVARSIGGSPRYFCSPECAARFVEEVRG